jgi:hypothetical protein
VVVVVKEVRTDTERKGDRQREKNQTSSKTTSKKYSKKTPENTGNFMLIYIIMLINCCFLWIFCNYFFEYYNYLYEQNTNFFLNK